MNQCFGNSKGKFSSDMWCHTWPNYQSGGRVTNYLFQKFKVLRFPRMYHSQKIAWSCAFPKWGNRSRKTQALHSGNIGSTTGMKKSSRRLTSLEPKWRNEGQEWRTISKKNINRYYLCCCRKRCSKGSYTPFIEFGKQMDIYWKLSPHWCKGRY